MKPFFSVVIPTYNRAHCILETIESVLQQSYPNWELILVDDGSTDTTAGLIKSVSDPRIRYFYKENGERGAARNFGIRQAVGTYVFFLDSDDRIKPGYLEYASELIAQTNAPCLHIPYNLLVGNVEKAGPVLKGDPGRRLMTQNRFACQVIVHRSCLEEFKFSENRDFKIGEDWYFILLLLSKYSFTVGEKRLGLIVQHETRSMAEAPYTVVLNSLEIFVSELRKNLPNADRLVKNVQHELTNLAALHAVLQKKRGVAFRLMFASIKYKPLRVFRYRNFVILKKIMLGR